MTRKKLRGLKNLVQDLVEHGSKAVERVQKETADRPFGILEKIPLINAPAAGVHVVFDVMVSGIHGAVRVANRAVGVGLDLALDAAEVREAEKVPVAGAPPDVEPVV
jgi:hypothetical protein